ncbi:hypothetical protein [Clostridium sp.]|uniref:hypothetical protein n=1 Tax=Clostridium sp. TaxID=1506 RepID=UPI002FC886EA
MDTNKIKIQLEKKYFNTKGFCKAVCQKLGADGYECIVDNSENIIVNGERYALEKWSINYESPIQEATFTKL